MSVLQLWHLMIFQVNDTALALVKLLPKGTKWQKSPDWNNNLSFYHFVSTGLTSCWRMVNYGSLNICGQDKAGPLQTFLWMQCIVHAVDLCNFWVCAAEFNQFLITKKGKKIIFTVIVLMWVKLMWKSLAFIIFIALSSDQMFKKKVKPYFCNFSAVFMLKIYFQNVMYLETSVARCFLHL